MYKFDTCWCIYEQAYVNELIVIERDARRFVYDLIENMSKKTDFIRAVG